MFYWKEVKCMYMDVGKVCLSVCLSIHLCKYISKMYMEAADWAGRVVEDYCNM